MDNLINMNEESFKEKHKNVISKNPSVTECLNDITVLDLSNRGLSAINEDIVLPINLLELNISHNKLETVPECVLKLQKLNQLNISYNKIKSFEHHPNFANTIEYINLSHNDLITPPSWIWKYSPAKLKKIDLSFNLEITTYFNNEYIDELMQYKMPATEIKLNNCRLSKNLILLSTFHNAKVIELGSTSLSLYSRNSITEIPFEGINCNVIEKLNLCDTQLYYIKPNIESFASLTQLDLSQNYLNNIPEEFSKLKNLIVCNLSHNHLFYLPDKIGDMTNIVTLIISHNELCILPDSIVKLTKLKELDLYDNCLNDFPNEILDIDKIDLALNYFDEPSRNEYLNKRSQLRIGVSERHDGRKAHNEKAESDSVMSDEEFQLSQASCSDIENIEHPPSSPEDWDSDDYWVPAKIHYKQNTTPWLTSWLSYVKRKMEEGNFCPIDAHIVSIAEKVKYEKLSSPILITEYEGQFDDNSDDNSCF